MIDGSANEFIDKMYYEDHYVIFNGQKYFVNGCQFKIDDVGNTVSVRVEVYNLSLDTTVFSSVKTSASECVEAFENAAIWNGKTFWEAEQNIKWIDD